ncbi:hypothetical protein [Hamadaea tsunoensis]|uniref:hypothetical protein n=1 Tax=Hamadaea tsunoensis TaxID=53368 RepID=UPI00041B4C1D|nr:hypothetical protein [Hamadaea tsunoensis]
MQLPSAARALAGAVDSAVTAARDSDAEALRSAAAELAPYEATTLLGEIVRLLLEEGHPDGLDGDDVRAVLDGCTRTALAWLPETSPEVLLVLVAGALGIHPEEADGIDRPSPAAVALHAPLLIAYLLRRPLAGYVTAAFMEIARAETMEAP